MLWQAFQGNAFHQINVQHYTMWSIFDGHLSILAMCVCESVLNVYEILDHMPVDHFHC